MRSILLVATASLCLLAGCNRGAANNSATANAPAANAAEPAPAANAGAPAPAAANRDNEIGECTRDMTRNLPAGSDVAGLCSCAVDRISAGGGQREAVTQCAAQLNITLPSGDGPEGGAESNSAE